MNALSILMELLANMLFTMYFMYAQADFQSIGPLG